MPTVISIPTPCHEDWNKMTTKDQGRHCNVCSKTVVDFTAWQPQQILLHFENNINVCGRFRTDQLDEPIPTKKDFIKQISHFSIPFLKKVAAIFFFVFTILGNSFKAQAQGEALIKIEDTSKTKNNMVYGNSISNFKCRIPLKVTTQKGVKKSKNKKHKSQMKSMAKKNDEFPTFVGYTYSIPSK
jgi:hypothetical protein